jgi:hypothetical protein
VDKWQPPHDWWAFLCWHSPATAVAAMTRVLEDRASEPQRLPRGERDKRIALIDEEIERLAYVEEALVNAALTRGEAVAHSSLPAAILGVRIAKEIMAEEREKRIERRASRVA